MSNKLLIGFAIAMLAAASAGCSTTDNANANANANANSAVASNTTQPGPDNSEITTSVDANGVKTETRVFHNNPRVAKVAFTGTVPERWTTVNGKVVAVAKDGKSFTTTHAWRRSW